MVTGRPTPYIPYLDPGVKIDPAGSVRDGFRADLREWIELDQSFIGLLSQIKEKAKDDPEVLALCEDIIQRELFLIKLSWWEINDIL